MPLMIWQGLCGQAFLRGKSAFADLRDISQPNRPPSEVWPSGNDFYLFAWQLRRTSHIKAILSVPIFKQIEPPPNVRYRVVGVINLDAVSESGAAWLADDVKGTTKYLADYGTTLAYLV